MARKVPINSGAPLLSADALLEKRVDSMMDPNASAEPESAVSTPATAVLVAGPTDTTPGAPIMVRRGSRTPTTASVAPGAVEPVEQAEPAEAIPDAPVAATDPHPEPEPASQAPTSPAHSFDTPLYDREAIIVRPINIDTSTSDAAIDDIVAQEADQVLAAEDAGLTERQLFAQTQAKKRRRGHPVFWFLILLLVILAVISAVALTNPNVQLP